ncbi:putative lipid II flippase FtsW [Halobacteriovorax marinus]|uniref:Probable peptidoglycan glycosyltransferase FtsW n=1 Tax=Halobacteriovorax marinus TaxID=97084 RepID=A0A1Y5F7Y8_9BACT|nr:putative lipid II flippase FtsW [Halobacteriovorax marinus]
MDKFSTYLKFALGTLIVVGVIMVYSASYMYAKEKFGNSGYFFLRQLLFVGVSLTVAFVISKTKYKFWLKFSLHINYFASFLLMLTFVPGLKTVVKGANRWLRIGGFTLQPGEFVKYTVILVSIIFFENFQKFDRNKRINYGVCMGLPFLLLILQPDFGTFSICFFGMSFVCFLSSFPRKYFYSAFVSGIILGGVVLVSAPYRVKRLLSFLNPWENAQGSGFQIIQSWIGFANGGFFGMGPGNSIEKLFYLPEAHNDFIFSVIGEEFGFLGVFLMAGLFLSVIYFGFVLAMKVKLREGSLLMAAIIFVIGIQSVLNMGVVLGLLPTKGLNLPFISYGGSSLLSNLFGLGLFFSVLRAYKESHLTSHTTSGEFNPHSNPSPGFQNLRNQASSSIPR